MEYRKVRFVFKVQLGIHKILEPKRFYVTPTKCGRKFIVYLVTLKC